MPSNDPAHSTLQTLIEQFNKSYPTNQACRDTLWTLLNPACPDCGSTKLIELKSRSSRRCAECNQHVSVTANTTLEGVHHLRPYFLIAQCFSAGLSISACQLAKITDIAFSTALAISLKVRLILMSELVATTKFYAASANGFVDVLFRRSFLTPAWQHPAIAEPVIDLAPETTGCVTPDATPIETDKPAVAVVQAVVNTVKSTIANIHHGISRRYLQLYVVPSATKCFSCETLLKKYMTTNVRNTDVSSYFSPPLILVFVD